MYRKVSNSWRQTIHQRCLDVETVFLFRRKIPRGLFTVCVCGGGGYRFVALHQLVAGDGFVQAGFAHVDVGVLGEAGQQPQQRLRVQVVVVVHVTKPPAGHKRTSQSNLKQPSESSSEHL